MESLRILVVDDDVDNAEGLADVFEMEGHKVSMAHRGNDALRIFSNQPIDVAFLDAVMPDMNGIESFFRIRNLQPNARVFMVTGYTIQQLLDEEIDKGALVVLIKPFDMGKLIESIEAARPGGIVLAAEDNPEFAEAARRTLAERGSNAHLARDGKEAMAAAQAGDIDVLILDFKRTVVDCMEVYNELRNLGRTVPIVIVVGPKPHHNPTSEFLRDMMVTGVLTKPYEPLELLEVLESGSMEVSAGGLP